MENKIDKINIEQNSVMFNGKYHFLNKKDWSKSRSVNYRW
jgi:hypothetical protein